jgi:hypothetical protein
MKPNGLKKLLLAGLIFSLLTACTASPKWTPHEGSSVGLYPGAHWHKVETPEKLGWSSEKLAQARAYSKQIGSAAVMIVRDRFYFKILGMKAYLSIFQRGDTLALYDPTGTLYGRFTISDT